jgi:hypothetical protein
MDAYGGLCPVLANKNSGRGKLYKARHGHFKNYRVQQHISANSCSETVTHPSVHQEEFCLNARLHKSVYFGHDDHTHHCTDRYTSDVKRQEVF